MKPSLYIPQDHLILNHQFTSLNPNQNQNRNLHRSQSQKPLRRNTRPQQLQLLQSLLVIRSRAILSQVILNPAILNGLNHLTLNLHQVIMPDQVLHTDHLFIRNQLILVLLILSLFTKEDHHILIQLKRVAVTLSAQSRPSQSTDQFTIVLNSKKEPKSTDLSTHQRK